MTGDEREEIRVYGRVCRTIIMRLNVCPVCKHYFINASKEGGIKACCDAFPEGIPRWIFDFGYDHREPYPNDKGIRFEIRSDFSEKDMEHLKRMQENLFSERNNREILRRREEFLKKNKEGKPEYDVYDYYGHDEKEDEFDFAFGEKVIAKYHIKFPDYSRFADCDHDKPRYIEETEKE